MQTPMTNDRGLRPHDLAALHDFICHRRRRRGHSSLRHQVLLLPSGSSFFLSLPSMKGDQGLAFTGPGVFQTTLNWPSDFTSPMNTGLCWWWFLASIVAVKPDGALKVWPAMAA